MGKRMDDKMNQIQTGTLTLMVNILTQLEAKTEMERGSFAMSSFGIIIWAAAPAVHWECTPNTDVFSKIKLIIHMRKMILT